MGTWIHLIGSSKRALLGGRLPDYDMQSCEMRSGTTMLWRSVVLRLVYMNT